MLINFHVRRLLKTDIFWSTITVDASTKERVPQRQHNKDALAIDFTVGAYAGGITYSTDGKTQLHNMDGGTGVCFTAPYATSKASGLKFTIELHNRHMKHRTSGEDL